MQCAPQLCILQHHESFKISIYINKPIKHKVIKWCLYYPEKLIQLPAGSIFSKSKIHEGAELELHVLGELALKRQNSSNTTMKQLNCSVVQVVSAFRGEWNQLAQWLKNMLHLNIF